MRGEKCNISTLNSAHIALRPPSTPLLVNGKLKITKKFNCTYENSCKKCKKPLKTEKQIATGFPLLIYAELAYEKHPDDNNSKDDSGDVDGGDGGYSGDDDSGKVDAGGVHDDDKDDYHPDDDDDDGKDDWC